jgi:import inner membrane translocase subunit TIM50
LKQYAGKDAALEYAKFEADAKRKHIEQWEKSGGAKKGAAVQGLKISKLFGGVCIWMS